MSSRVYKKSRRGAGFSARNNFPLRGGRLRRKEFAQHPVQDNQAGYESQQEQNQRRQLSAGIERRRTEFTVEINQSQIVASDHHAEDSQEDQKRGRQNQRFGPVGFRAFMDQDDGHYIQGLYNIGNLYLVGRYDEFRPNQKSEDKLRISSGIGYSVNEIVNLRLEYQIDESDDNFAVFQVAFKF